MQMNPAHHGLCPDFPATAEDAHGWLSMCMARAARPVRPEFAQGFPAHVELRSAAVLIAILWHEQEPSILLTRRTEALKSHAGQISFPGGKVDALDASVVDAALREAWEEVGLAQDRVSVVGEMEVYPTLSGFAIHPVVGIVTVPVSLVPEPGEVAEIFELPLARALDLSAYQRHAFNRGGVTGEYYSLTHEEHFIWGATAGMLHQLAVRLA
ncbi:CoA pyrophosphatase [Craterilacuibacter sp. RT1T]|uniref:CoA pyrophosphatase n=1 Tax=Craterilacuibacter sp. RT1T TaxID=2942211 RepID=UPI0020C036B2|nr:CoA pyrophosphatase [Craterilacuibacter sp. RT1T]MCL6262349.1 CoA pyrophosphatase [Craterilacuibacter sp. RT1T]